MPQLTEDAAADLPPGQAADLARVVDLEAAWENLRDGPSDDGADRLRRLQAAFASYRARAAEYAAKYRTARFPELTPSGPDRLGRWCRTVRAIARRAAGEPGTGPPVHAARKAVRLAERIAARVGRPPVEGSSDAAGVLDVVIQWCDGPPGTG